MTTMEVDIDKECDPSEQNSIEDKFNTLLNESKHVLFTGYFNGFSVEIRSMEEMSYLYHMESFGKGSFSRSKPLSLNMSHKILRKRQFSKRLAWHKKFEDKTESEESKQFLEDIDKLTAKIISDRDEMRDIINLVSSDESEDEENLESVHSLDKHEVVIVVPNSDSEGDDYFENFKPQCCASNVVLEEKLILSMQEAYFLSADLCCLQIIDDSSNILSLDQCWIIFNELDKNFTEKYVVYHYYRSKGFIVKPGIKFGGDYLLYKNRPGISHADFIVLIKLNEDKYKLDWITILGHVRMAATTVKKILLVEVFKNSNTIANTQCDLNNYNIQETLVTRNTNEEIIEDKD